MVELRQLQYFLAVAEQLNFSKAAKLLYVTQPLLSQQITELENQLDVTLFLRTRRSVSLTPAGEALAKEAHAIIGRANGLTSLVQQAASGKNTELTINIGFELLFERTRLTQGVLKFHGKYSSHHCNMHSYTYGKLVRAISDGEIDIGFTITPNKGLSEDLIQYPLWEDFLVLVVSKELYGDLGREELLQVVKKLNLLLIEADPRGNNNVLELCKDLNIFPRLQLLNDAYEVLMNVEGGNGFTLLPSSFVNTYGSPWLSTLRLNQYENAKLTLAAIYHRNSNNPITNQFLDFLNE